jgi:hypothetical protein
MCNKKMLFFAFCIIGLQSTTMKPMDLEERPQQWEQERWNELGRYKDVALNNFYRGPSVLSDIVAQHKVKLLQTYTDLAQLNKEPDLKKYTDKLDHIAKVLPKEINSIANNIMKIQKVERWSDDLRKEISQASTRQEIDSIVDKYNYLTTTPNLFTTVSDTNNYLKAKQNLEPEVLLQELGLPTLESTATLSTPELYSMFKKENILPEQPTVWRRITNFFSSGSNKPSSMLGFTQVPLQTQASRRYYNFAMPEGMRQRFQELKQRARKFPTKQLTPQQAESRLYEHYTMPSPESSFVTPH